MSLFFYRHDLDELPINAINPSLSTSSNDTQESTLSTNEVNSTELPPETVPQFPTTGNTAQVSTTDGHHSSISEPPIAIDDSREESTANKTSTGTGTASTAGTSVEEVSSAIANACTLSKCIFYWYVGRAQYVYSAINERLSGEGIIML